MSFISAAHAQTTGAAVPPTTGLESFIPIILIFAVFYFLLIRPQSKRLKEHDAMVKALQRNDKVITGGGILGKITKVNDQDNIIEVEIAPSVKVQVNRSSITEVISGKAKAANDDASSKKSSLKKKV